MTHYLLSTYTVERSTAPEMEPEQMQASWAAISALEAEMKASGAFVFSARLHGPDTVTVVRSGGADFLMTDGPFAESKEHLGGFYIIEAPDLDAALAWAKKVVDCIGQPIEVWPFAGIAMA
jgi:hypothetical protein